MRTLASIALAATVAACGEGGTPPCVATIVAWGDGMPDFDMLVGDTVETHLEDHFRSGVCLRSYANAYHDRYWIVQSADPSSVAVQRNGVVLTTAALAVADSVRVTVDLHPFGDVGAPDPFDVQRHEFLVRVRPPSAGR